MQSLKGQFVVASRQLRDPNFMRTVVLMIQHSHEGAFGVVLNRPFEKTIGELWEEFRGAPCENDQPLNEGGPVSGSLIAIHSAEPLGEIEICEGVYFSADDGNLSKLVGQTKDHFKLFVGYAGWASEQLEDEIEQGAWLTMPATKEYVFLEDGDLWKIATRQIVSAVLLSTLKVKHVPDDPTVN